MEKGNCGGGRAGGPGERETEVRGGGVVYID